MAAELLPFLSGTLHTIIQEIAKSSENPIATEIIRIDNLVNQAISIQYAIPEILKSAIKEKIIDTSLTGEVSMLAVRMDGSFNISFLPKDKQPEYSANGVWSRKNRQEGKIGKVFQKALVAEFKQYTWEKFVNLFKAEICQCNNFELVSGEDIRKWYNEDTYFSLNGSLGNSCMRYHMAQNFMDIYVENAKMLITTRDGKLTGRAIVWEIDEKTTILDRIYVCYDYLENCFTEYAKEHKWLIRENNSLLHTGEEQYWRTPDDDYASCKYIEFKIKLKNEYEYFPYVDSFRYLSYDKMTISNTHGPYALDCTDGDYSHESELCCDNCGRTFYDYSEDDLPDELHYSDWADCYLCDNCCYYSEYIEDYIPNTVPYYRVITRFGDQFVPQECVDEYLVTVTTSDDGSSITTGDIVEIDGTYYDLNCTNLFYNKDTNKYEIRSDTN